MFAVLAEEDDDETTRQPEKRKAKKSKGKSKSKSAGEATVVAAFVPLAKGASWADEEDAEAAKAAVLAAAKKAQEHKAFIESLGPTVSVAAPSDFAKESTGDKSSAVKSGGWAETVSRAKKKEQKAAAAAKAAAARPPPCPSLPFQMRPRVRTRFASQVCRKTRLLAVLLGLLPQRRPLV